MTTWCAACGLTFADDSFGAHLASVPDVRAEPYCYRPWDLDVFDEVDGVWQAAPRTVLRRLRRPTGRRPNRERLMEPWTDEERGR